MIIIAVYINIEGLSRQRADEELVNFQQMLNHDNPEKAIYHIIPRHRGESKMELIYPPSINTDTLKELIKEIKIEK